MSNLNTIDRRFASPLFELRHARMYPSEHRKESAMKRLTLEHVSSLARAESLMIGAIVTPMSPVLRKSIEDDIERLTEIKRFILKALYQPGLPFTTKIPEHPDPDGDSSS